ncbi:MAG: M42 family metallopeptidase [Symbiobacteriaceae bacterium]|nr:M42 family metallopeptidase [Symbiobacteriaceae bacterium]
MDIKLDYTLDMVKKLMAIDSPSGFTHQVVAYVGEIAASLGLKFTQNQKGNGVITLPGAKPSGRALSAHVDTLGLMVRSVTSGGTLKFVRIGGLQLNTADGEYCTIHTRSGKVYTGTVLSTSPSGHVFPDSSSKARDEANMEIRLDEIVKNKDDVLKLGIAPGDYICLDTKTQITPSGFIKSRFLDDKLSAAILLGVLHHLKEHQITLPYDVKFLFSTYEEVGHGMAQIPADVTEVLAVDMGCIGLDLNCTEMDVSICARDSSGPYDYHFTSKLIELAQAGGIGYALDIYPQYGSDVSAALRAGNDIKGALIGPGVAASHGMERSHIKAVENTMKLVLAYLQSE